MLPVGGERVDIKTSGTTNLTDEQRIGWLRLIRSDNVGPRGIMAQTPQAL
jgi:DNA processing protein